MKNKLSKRFFAFMLAILTVAVGIPLAAFAEGETAVYTVIFATGTEDTVGEDVTVEVFEGAEFTLPQNTFTREGFEFAGWHDGTSQYEAGASYTANKNVTFVPVWKNILSTRIYYSADGYADTNGDGIYDVVNATVTPSLIGSSSSTGNPATMNIYSGTCGDITCIASGGDVNVTCDSIYNIYGGTVTGNIFGVSRYSGNENKVHTLNGNNTYNIYGGEFAGVICAAWKRGSVLNGILTFNINGGRFTSGMYFGFGTAQWSQRSEINGAQNFIINNKEIAQNGGSLAGVDIGIKATATALSKYDNLIVIMNNAEYAEQTGAEVSANSVATHTLYVTGGKATPKFNESNTLIGFEIVSDTEEYVPVMNGTVLEKNENGYYDIAAGVSNISFVASHTVTYIAGTYDTQGETVTHNAFSGVSFVLPECTFIREGFEFAGWHDGTSQYEAGASYTANKNVTFVPVWKNILSTRIYYSADGYVDTNSDGIYDVVNATVTPSLVGSSSSTGNTATMNIYSGTCEITCMASGVSASATCDSIYNIYGGNIGHIFGVSRYTGANTSVVHTLNGDNIYNIYGGDFSGVLATSYKMGSVINGNLTFNISGGRFTSGMYFGFGGTQWSPRVEINGTQSFIINNKEIAQKGGTLSGVDIGIKPSTLTKYGNLVIVMNNAEYAEQTGAEVSANSVATHTLYVTGGKATPKFDETDCLIGFEIISDVEGYVPAIDGVPLHENAYGYYDIAAGTSEITFTDDVDYTTNGEVIEFYKDMEFDVSSALHSEKDGKLFMGWTFENGASPEGNSFKAGDKLYARYIDFDLNKDFYIEGAQIRFGDEANNISEGLRFVIRRTSATDALDINGYGSVIIPSLAVGKEELEMDRVYVYNSKEYTVAKVPADRIYSKNDDYEQYTICVVNITEKRYSQLLSVRGYIEYTDYNGADHVIYTDYYATNFVNVAQAILDDERVTDQTMKARSAQVVETEKQRVRDKYNGLEKITLSNNYPDEASRAEVDPEYMYQLGEGGVTVREVLIETGDPESEMVEIFQLSDLHFNYCNKEDFEEANPSILASYNGRQWLKDGESVPNAVKALEYASQGDAIVITGDVIDFMSHGAVELTQKYIWDPYPKAFVALGNHDMERRCQDNPSTPDPTSYKSRYDFLQQNWNHDVYYSSKVIKNKVMIIQLDNGTTKFWDSQIELLTNDLAEARENGYTVLLFYHIPLCTNNPEEKDLYPIRKNDTFNYNFCDTGVGSTDTTHSATLSVYDIITNNADIIKGTFCGHFHSDYKTEIIAKNADGTPAVIPQWILTGNPYDGGHVLKIAVK